MLINVYNHTSFAFSTKEWLKQTSQFALSEWNIAWLHPHGEKNNKIVEQKTVRGLCSTITWDNSVSHPGNGFNRMLNI